MSDNTYTDSEGDTWTEVLSGDGRAIFLQDVAGEVFTFNWVEERFGPLEPGPA